MSKIHIETYGCTANQSDSELMQKFLEEAGHKITDLKASDYVVINSCGVKTQTEERIIQRLKTLSKKKRVIIGGCLPKINLERIEKENIAGILDTRSIDKLPKMIEKISKGEKALEFSDTSIEKPDFVRSAGLTGIVQLSEGCNLSCSYCATTISRGDLQCFSPESIVRGVSYLVKGGCKEILLTSQDNGAYLYKGQKLPDILKDVCQIDRKFYVRNGMTNPVYLKFLNQFIEAYKSEKVYKFLHIPVQSGSNKVLKDMKRGYTVENFKKTISAFEKEFPMLLATDIIVGFPTETEEDFQETLKLLEEIRFDMVNISRFGKRPGTEAANMQTLDSDTMNRRSKKASQVAKKIIEEKNREWVGWKGKILINEIGKLVSIGSEKQYIGRNLSYKPVLIKSEKNLLGKELNVEIKDSTIGCLIGEII